MKAIMSVFLVALSFISANTFAASSKGDAMNEVLSSYLKIQEALASDSLDQVQIEAAKIVKRATDKEIKAPAQSLSRDATLEAARSDFKRLSTAMDKWAATTKPEGVQRMTCPMVNAPWIQKRGETKNPYYGKQMQSCGEVQK
ncbi:DUF3347 domain-containing protein [bacterium]|nr:DUF3347 domain-containing protein [bacterium]